MESARMTDREKAGLRGPVSTCVEETIFSCGDQSLTATEYGPDGRLLATRIRNSDGSEWLTTHTYHADGRLARIVSGKLGEPGIESLYSYDEAGRLLTITKNNENRDRIDFQYDERGRKTTIQFSPRVQESYAGGVGCVGNLWRAAEAGRGIPSGGSVTTIHDEHDQPSELQIREAEGQLYARIHRTYDGNGQIIEEILVRPAEDGQLTPEQIEQTQFATLYTYDTQGRVTKLRERKFGYEKTITIIYNDQGDKAEEHNEWTVHPDTEDEVSDVYPELRYKYQYDSYGNWTLQTVIDSERPHRPTDVHHRKLTYYCSSAAVNDSADA